jgi:membrane-associated phospholipid phosphatase
MRRLSSVSLLLALTLLASPALCRDNIELAGDALQIVLPLAAAGITIGKQDWWGLLRFTGALAATEAVTYGLKYSIDEERPNGGHYSFPSGHSSVSFCAAEFVGRRYGWEYGVAAYALASFVGYSRVESNNHYWHDVLAGAAIGIASSYLLAKPLRKTTVTPVVGDGVYGLRLSRVW